MTKHTVIQKLFFFIMVIAVEVLVVSSDAFSQQEVKTETGAELNQTVTEVAKLPSWLSGKIATNFYLPESRFNQNNIRQSLSYLWLQGNPHFTTAENGGTESSGYFTLLFKQQNQLSLDLREAYLKLRAPRWAPGFEWSVGQQIIPWGKSDVTNPTDYLTAKNYSLLTVDDEMKKLGSIALSTIWTLDQGNSPFNFTFVWQPKAPQSILQVNPALLPVGAMLGDAISPRFTLAQSEVALKAAYLGQSFDVSLSYFNGYYHLPYFIVSGNPLTPLIQTQMDRVQAYGTDASWSFDSYVARFESAYFSTRNDGRNLLTGALTQPSHWDTVVGIERGWNDHWRLQLQALYRHHPHWVNPTDTPLAVRPLSELNARVLNYQERSRLGGTLRFAYTDNESGVDAEVLLMGNVMGKDYLVRPKFSYAWTDAIRTSMGLDHYGGPKDRSLGSLYVYNSIFLEGKLSF